MEKTRQAVSIVILSFLIITLTSKTYQATDSNPLGEAKIDVLKSIGNLPAFFIENQGQTAGEVRYYFKGSDTVYFTNEAVVFQKIGARGQGVGDREDSEIRNPNSEFRRFGPMENNVACESCPRQIRLGGLVSHAEGFNVPDELARYSLSYKLEFVGANPTAPIAKSELEGKVNYLIGNDPSTWHTDVPTYQEIVYPGLYQKAGARENNVACESCPRQIRLGGLVSHAGDSGIVGQPSVPDELARYSEAGGTIDLIYKGVPGGMKYEFIVHPGANPDDIRLAYTGIEGLSLDDSGNLIIHTALGDVKDERPYTYQEIDGKKVEVTAEFRLISSPSPSLPPTPYSLPPSSYGFEIASYDENYPLVIDPGLQYSTFLGGSSGDSASSIALDSSGNAFVTGETRSSNFPTTPGAYDTSISSQDVFVTKLNSTGSGLIYSTFLGGSGNDVGNGIALNSSGNAFVVGHTVSINFPTTTGAFDRSYNGGSEDGDAFVTKLNPTGSGLVYSTFLGGSGDEGSDSIAVDSSGNAFVTGNTDSSNFPTTTGAFDRSYNGGAGGDAFVTKLNPTGSGLLYSTFLGGSGDEWDVEGIAVNGSGNAFVTGKTNSSNFPTTTGAYDTSYNGGGNDAFVTKLNPTGSALVYSTFLGGSGDEGSDSIAVDSSGNAFVGGNTASSNFPTTAGAYDTGYNGGGNDAFVTKLNPTGSGLVYSTFLGGSGIDGANNIAVDSSSNAFVTGGTRSSNFPTTPGAYDRSYNGNQDAFVTKLNPTGSGLIYSTFLGGSGNDSADGIAVNSSGYAFVVGGTGSSNFPTTTGAYDTSHNGGALDGFVTKLDPFVSGQVVWGSYFNREGSLADMANSVATRGTRVFVAGYTTTTAGGRAFSVRAYYTGNGTLLWQNHFDRQGSLTDEANSVVVSGDGSKVFVAGYTTTTAGGRAFSVRAYNTGNGTLLWQNHFDRQGSLWDTANSVAVSADGTKVFVAGYTSTSAGSQAFSVRAYNATNGALLWQNHLDRQGSRADVANSVAVSANGTKVFAAGYTSTSAGGTAFSVRAYNATNGTLLWQNHFDRQGSRADVANSVAVSGDGTKVFVAGSTSTTAGGLASSVRAYNATNGTLLWQNYLDRQGSLDDEANSVVVSADGTKVFTAGSTTTTAGGQAFSVRAYNATNGALLWQNHFDRQGSLDDEANSVVISADGSKVFVVGSTSTTAGGLASSVRAYNATNGALLWQNHLDRQGSLDDVAKSVAVMGNSNVFVVGYTTTTSEGQAFAVRELRQ